MGMERRFCELETSSPVPIELSGFLSCVRPRGLFARCAHGVKSPNSMAEFAEEFPSEKAETPYLI